MPSVPIILYAVVAYVCLRLLITIHVRQAFQIENEKLKKTLEEYHAEFAHVKNQGEHATYSISCDYFMPHEIHTTPEDG